MPYSQATLTTIYTNSQVGIVPSAATQTLLAAYAAQNAAGTLSDAQALNSVLALADPTTAVALESYQFFTGSTPTAAGLAFLVNSPTNATDLNDPYYAQFNQANRFINFAANLGTGTGAGAANFAATYGSLSFNDAVNAAYETIIGSGNATAVGIDPNAGKAYVQSQLGYFTAFARQNNPTATTAQLDLLIKAEAVGFLLNEATKANVGFYASSEKALLADLGPDNIAILGTNLLTSYGTNVGGAVNLTSGTDILTGNVFNAGLVFSPGGDVRLNSLQDEDQLTGVGTNPTLNLTFGNPSLNAGQTITPVLNNIQTVNIAFTGSGDNAIGAALTNPTLDVQDATGITTLNLSRISNTTVQASVINLQAEPTAISITNTNAPAAQVNVLTSTAALLGTANASTLTLNNAQIAGYQNNSVGGGNAITGLENLTLVSQSPTSGAGNVIGQLNVAGLQTLTIQGAGGNANAALGTFDLSLGTPNVQVLSPVAGSLTQSEAQVFTPGFINATGTLTTVNASAFTGNLNIDFSGEATGGAVANSGASVNLQFTGGSGNDTVRFSGTVADSAADVFDGGTGVNTLALASTTGVTTLTTGTFLNFQVLDLRTGGDLGNAAADTATINLLRVPTITSETLRNEGQATQTIGGVTADYAAAELGTFNLNNLSVVQAQNINVLHGTTGNSTIGQTILNTTFATDTANDVVGITISPGANADLRNNWVFNLAGAENVSIIDRDAESSTVAFGNIAQNTGLLYLTGGTTGTFMNFDASNAGAGIDFYRLNETGVTTGTATGDVDVTTPTASVVEPGTGAAYRFGGTSFDSTTSLDNVVLRVQDSGAPNGAQNLQFGVGNDTVIFDQLNNNRAGLSISDTVSGGAGVNTLVFDGETVPVSIGASEWTNVSGFVNIRTVGNGVATNTVAGNQTVGNGSLLASQAGVAAPTPGSVLLGGTTSFINAYNLTLTNDMINKNGVGSSVNIINDNDTGNNGLGLNTAGTAVERGITINALSLDANHFFTYNGEEGSSRTADRIILSDANINGRSVIDGGAVFGALNAAGTAFATSNLANQDVLEIRDAAVVSAGDLANISNMGTLQFTNDTATNQTSVLELTATVVDALVNSTRAAAAGFVENLTVGAYNNPALAAATTTVQMDVRAINTFETVTLQGSGNFVITVNNVAQQAQVVTNAGGFTGTFVFQGPTGGAVPAAAPAGDAIQLVGVAPVSVDHHVFG